MSTKSAKRVKIGRPTLYCQKLTDKICTRLRNGESLTKICEEANMPDESTVYYWLEGVNCNEEDSKLFLKKYNQARKRQADSYADATVKIADDLQREIEESEKEGGKKLFADYLSAKAKVAELRMKGRHWHAARLRPKKYGDQQNIKQKTDSKVEITDAGDAKSKLFEKLSKKIGNDETT